MHIQKLLDNTYSIAIWGMGYLGYHSLIKYSKLGINCVLIDNKYGDIEQLRKHYETLIKDYWNYNSTVDLFENCKLTTIDKINLKNISIHVICVPVEKTGKPTNEYLKVVFSKLKEIEILDDIEKPLIIIESSVSPGTTENVIMPLLKDSNKILGRDYLLAVAPRRDWDINPSLEDASFGRLIGSTDSESLSIAKQLVELIGDNTVLANSFFEVELARCVENTIQYINIALANQLCQAFPNQNINKIMKLVSTHPKISDVFLPVAGIGGFNYYMSSFFLPDASDFPESLTLIKESMRTDYEMISIITDKIMSQNVSSVLILGLSYKPNSKLYLNSPAIKFLMLFKEKGVEVKINDLMFNEEELYGITHEYSALFPDDVSKFEAILLLTNHNVYKRLNYTKLKEQLTNTRIIVDTCQVWSHYDLKNQGFPYFVLGGGLE